MKMLLLSDIPPCSDLTAGLVLAQLCRLLPRESLACFVVLNPHLRPQLFPDLDWIPTRTVRKPNETGVYRRNGLKIGGAGAFCIETYKRLALTPRLVNAACAFAREQSVDAIWAVLQGQTIVRMAVPLAQRLGVPLYTQVWDPLSWWLKAHKVDRVNAWLTQRDFALALRKSEACATASWAMAELFERSYGTRSVPVISGHHVDMALQPAPIIRNEHELVIGMAGQFYANEEWGQLINALGLAGWRVGSRRVRLKVLGRVAPSGEIPPESVDYLGWKGQGQTIKVLSEDCDLLYCPYPFAPEMAEVSRLSFPSKLSTYFAAGRPVLFHGPSFASPSVYLQKAGAGFVCNDFYPAGIYNALQVLVERPELYAQLAAASQATFQRDFTLKRMGESFFEFLGQAGVALMHGPEPSPAVPSLIRKTFSAIRRSVYRTFVPRRIERRIVLASADYRELANRHNSLGEQLGQVDVSRTDLAEQLRLAISRRDDLAQQLNELDTSRNDLNERLAHLQTDWEKVNDAQLQRITALEHSVAEHRITVSTQLEQVARLEEALAERDATLSAQRQAAASMREENAAFRSEASAFRIANENQNALVTGKLSLLDYQIQSLLRQDSTGHADVDGGRTRYLDLLEAALVGLLIDDPPASPWSGGKFDANIRAIGRDWPRHAQTMIGKVRMRNIRYLLERVVNEMIPGDVIETGVWRGGACIYMRGILAAHGVEGRTVWVADSFRGLPSPDEAAFPADRGDRHHTFDELAVPLADVKRNFERYGLLDDRVQFLEGWFKDTLPAAPIDRLALLRLDGDMYGSTIQALDALYWKVSPGGYVIIDDYILEPCRQAVDDFRARHGITAPLEQVDGAAVFWCKHTSEEEVSSDRPCTSHKGATA